MKVELWYVRDTSKARCYSRIPPSRKPVKKDLVWLPISQIEHVTKYTEREGVQVVTIPEWLAKNKDLL